MTTADDTMWCEREGCGKQIRYQVLLNPFTRKVYCSPLCWAGYLSRAGAAPASRPDP